MLRSRTKVRKEGNVLVDDVTGNPVASAGPTGGFPVASTPEGTLLSGGQITPQSLPEGRTVTTPPPTTGAAQQIQQELSSISGIQLTPNRVSKFFLPQGEVSKEEFNRAKGEAAITTEQGGRSALNKGGGLLPETRADLLNVDPSTLTPDLQRELASIEGQSIDANPLAITADDELSARRELALQVAGTVGVLAFGRQLVLQTIGRTAATKGALAKLGVGFGFPVVAQKKKVSEASNNFANAEDAIDNYAGLVKSGQMSYTDGIGMIQEELNNILRSEKALKIMSSDPLIGNLPFVNPQTGLADITAYKTYFNNVFLPDLQQNARLAAVGAKPL